MKTSAIDYEVPFTNLEEALSEFDAELESQLATAKTNNLSQDDQRGASGRPWSEVRPEFIALIEKTFSQAD